MSGRARATGRVRTTLASTERVLLHPLAIALLPLPAIAAILFAERPHFGLLGLIAALLIALAKGPGFALRVALVAIGATALLWFGFALSLQPPGVETQGPPIEWLPLRPSPEKAVFALRGALRLTSIMTLYTVTMAFVRWDVLSDTLIDRFRASYRVVDVTGLGGRFAVLIRRDIAAAHSIARLRARGRLWRTLRLSAGLTIPVLMASFRHSDELSIAMEARGFGMHPTRTVHHSVAPRLRDWLIVALVWAATIGIAAALERMLEA